MSKSTPSTGFTKPHFDDPDRDEIDEHRKLSPASAWSLPVIRSSTPLRKGEDA